MESRSSKVPKTEINFDFAKNDIKDIYLLSNLSKTLLEDLERWAKERSFKYALINEIKAWIEQNKEEDFLAATAKASVSVIDHLLAKGVPFVVIEAYLQFLGYHKQRLEKQKYLDHDKAGEIYIYIPTILMVPFLRLYRIKLSHKQKHTIIKEIIQNKDTCQEKILGELPRLFNTEYEYYADVLIRELQNEKKENIAGRVMKKLKIPKNKYPDIYETLLELAAIGLMRRDSEFTWEKLEEVFELYPKALATCIRVHVNDKRTQRLTINGFASICRRNESLYGLMPKKVAQILKKVQFELPNKLRNDRFLPSDPKIYFTLNDFNIKEQNVVWVDNQNLQHSLLKLSGEKLIGIDTESRVARTCLDTSKELMATIQIATSKEVYIFDAKVLRQNTLRIPQIQEFFRNKEVTIIGHTLSADLNGDVTQLLGFKGKVLCKAVDICPIFKQLYPDEKRASLTYISEKILGRQICKEYTLTNWERRPLLKNQLHYAALDAVIVIKIWEQMRQHKDYVKIEKEVEEKLLSKKEDRRLNKTQQNGEPNRLEADQQQQDLEEEVQQAMSKQL